ncbi:hypothetical protein [Nonomuraea sediminis]|uniref:hypothetical protein n=1 Tax=Nonomuraea sediminis TaxID=2835864 RepID=UPI001BDC04F4|nr:hypothetical protein [Nonomuraea sediminis]
MDTPLLTVIVPLAALIIVYRQMMTRPTERPGILYLAIALAVLGLASGGIVDSGHLGVSIALVAVEVVCAVVFGVVRAATVRVWHDAAGVTWSKATGWTLLAWVVSIASRVGLYFAGAALGLAVSTGGLLLFIGLTIGVQSLLVTRRGRMLAGAPRAATLV